MIIAVDADGTLFDKKWYPNVPPEGEYNMELINLLIERKRKGDKIILWTCREGRPKTIVVRVIQRLGLTFDAVNGNVESYAHARKKIVADIYVDDKAVRPEELQEIIECEGWLDDNEEAKVKLKLGLSQKGTIDRGSFAEYVNGSSTTEEEKNGNMGLPNSIS